MGLLAEYEITCEGLPFVAVAKEVPETTLELKFHPSESHYTAFLVRVTEGPADAVEQAFEAGAFVADYAPIEREDATPCYRVEPAISISMRDQLGDYVDDVTELQALAAADADIKGIRVTATGWIQSGWFADRETLDSFRSFWERNGRFQLRRLTPAADAGDADAGLTDRQREALLTANEMGYFEIPRTASLEDVADELEITASSLSERLRRAHSHLIDTVVSYSID
ncbi:helix-turn-helix domain-containing protein [Halovenus salina]|uniref:Helix-turn-helix domain-containing protein n=1 Tax=Halovenus salina TaxID=1510225 RepID=A0ABD5W216_9EURY|nr:helix-turn-helix domain-containing protein [Halovenus salina]